MGAWLWAERAYRTSHRTHLCDNEFQRIELSVKYAWNVGVINHPRTERRARRTRRAVVSLYNGVSLALTIVVGVAAGCVDVDALQCLPWRACEWETKALITVAQLAANPERWNNKYTNTRIITPTWLAFHSIIVYNNTSGLHKCVSVCDKEQSLFWNWMRCCLFLFDIYIQTVRDAATVLSQRMHINSMLTWERVLGVCR